jgi:Tfp pilus assembly protein PilF
MEAALALRPDDVRALVNSARALIGLEKFVEAEQRATRAVEIDSLDADAWNVLGRTQLNLLDVAAATEAFHRATELDPHNAHAFNNTGYALIQQQEWQAAADALETAIALRDDVAWFHNNLGVVYEQLDRPMQAAAAWQRALELQPEYDKASMSLARIEPRVRAIEKQLAEAGLPIGTQAAASQSEGEETMRDGSQSPPREDVVDVDGTEAGRDSQSEQSGSGATEETPEGSISPQ